MTHSPPPWILTAEAELGVSEVPGPKSNQRILEYHKSTLLQATSDSVPWCAGFVGWVLNKSKLKGTRSAAARSYLNWGKELKEPRFGCVVILKRGEAWQGHVGFFVGSTKPETIRVLGGNQSNKVSIQNFPKKDVLGFRWPNK